MEELRKKLSIGETISYSLGSLGREVSNNCINVFFLAYLNIFMGLDSLVLTIAFVLAKLWDTINDPILATFVNNTKKGRFGRYRPWIAIGAILNAICLVCMFIPVNFSEVGKYAYYIGLYVLWGMSFTLVDVPFWSMIPTIAETTDERNQITSMSKLIGGFGGFTISTIGTALIIPVFYKTIGNKAYLVLGAVTGLLLLGFIAFTIFGNRERYDLPSENCSLKEIFKLFKTNDQLVAYAISFVLFSSAATIALFQILYLFIYYGESGIGVLKESHYGIFTAVACTGQGIAMIFYSLITKKIPREKLYGYNYFMAIIGMICMFLIFYVLGDNAFVNVLVVALAGAFLMTSNGLNQIGSTVMIADVVDYGEYKTGKRADSIIFSVQTLLGKFAGAIAMLIIGIGIKVAKLPQIAEKFNPETNEFYKVFVSADGSEAITNSSLDILRLFMFIVPIPLCIIGYIVYIKKYTLYGEKYDKIMAEVLKRRAEMAEGEQKQDNITDESKAV